MGVSRSKTTHRSSSTAGRPVDIVAMLHELYAMYPGENHAVLARAVVQARRNVSVQAGEEAIGRETRRLLAIMMKGGSDALHEGRAHTRRS